MARKDFYYNKAKQEGYRSRAAYKLTQLDDREDLFAAGDAVVDLGAAPGGWMQVAARAVGETGTVIGVDFQEIEPIETAATTESIRGDVTEEKTIEAVRDRLPGGSADVVLSDMAPEMTGEYSLDQARSLHLADTAREIAETLLAPGGHLVVKVFEGDGVDDLRTRMEDTFEHVSTTSPDASRDSSSEVYLIGKRYIDPPVAVGSRHDVKIEDEGREGDGIARLDGYTIFVPGTTTGDRVTVEITGVKADYGFAERVDTDT